MDESWHPAAGEIAVLFATLSRFQRIILAVSGGSDSMAMMHLVARWRASRGIAAPLVEVATVDHGLRAESRAEALRVADAAARLGLTHHILTWAASKPERALQDHARQARYTLLGELARRNGTFLPVAILTAHTREDQAETLLMRLARGSGPDGLQGMRAERSLDGGSDVMLVRPLLGMSRADLRGWLSGEGLDWIEDPSNEDVRFERVRLRRAAPVLDGIGLTAPMLARAARRQGRAVDALENATSGLARACVALHYGAFASVDGAAFAMAPAELRVRLLGRVLRAFGGTTPAADLAQIERLADDLASGAALRATLGGCQIRACARQIRVFREPGRAGLSSIALAPGQSLTWDGRFLISTAVEPTAGSAHLEVRPLAPEVLRDLSRRMRPRWPVPARAAATLPAVWRGCDLVAIGGVPPAVLVGSTEPGGPDGSVTLAFLYDAELAPLLHSHDLRELAGKPRSD